MSAAQGPAEAPVIVVTGASRGLGAALAERLAARGAHLVLVARTVGGLEEVDDRVKAAGGTATLVPLDLGEPEGIERLGAALYERFRRVDVVIGNAAVLGQLSPVGHVPPELWDKAFRVNVTANWRLIRSLDPLLRQAPAGRALFVTCAAGRDARAYWGAYAASKAALEMLVATYAAELNQTRVRAGLVDPGPMRTRLRATAYPGEAPASVPDPAAIAARIDGLLAADFDNGARLDASA